MVDYTKWPCQNVKMWLQSEGLSELATACYQNGITGSAIPDLTDSFLRSLPGISQTDREKFNVVRRNLMQSVSHGSNKLAPPEPRMDVGAKYMIDSKDSRYSGWIIKQGGRFRNWRRRYMVLNKGILYYYERETAAQPKGYIILPGHVVQEAYDFPNIAHCLKLVHKNPSKRAYYIGTAARHELDKWNSHITDEIEKYKEENLLGQPIYGENSTPNTNKDESYLGDSNSDEDPDDTNYIEPLKIVTPLKTLSNSPRKNQTYYNGNKNGVASPTGPGLAILRGTTECSSMHTRNPLLRNSTQRDIKTVNTEPSKLSSRTMIKSSSCSIFPDSSSARSSLSSESSEDPYLEILPESHKSFVASKSPKKLSLPEDPYLEIIPETQRLPTQTKPPKKLSMPEDPYLEIIPEPNKLSMSPKASNKLLLTERSHETIPESHKSSFSSRPPNKPLPTIPPQPSQADLNSPVQPPPPAPYRYEYTTLRDEPMTVGFNVTMDSSDTSLSEQNMDDSSDYSNEYISPVVKPLPSGCIQLEFSRDRAEDTLRSMNVGGMYLIRNGSEENSQVLTVWAADRCKHYKIFKHDNGYCLHKGVYFPSLIELILSYRSQDLPKSEIRLTIPYNMQGNRQ